MKCSHSFVYINGRKKGHCLICHQELVAVTTTHRDDNLVPAVMVETTTWLGKKEEAQKFIAELERLEKEVEDQGVGLLEPPRERRGL